MKFSISFDEVHDLVRSKYGFGSEVEIEIVDPSASPSVSSLTAGRFVSLVMDIDTFLAQQNPIRAIKYLRQEAHDKFGVDLHLKQAKDIVDGWTNAREFLLKECSFTRFIH